MRSRSALRPLRLTGLLALLLAAVGCAAAAGHSAPRADTRPAAAHSAQGTRHWEYVFVDGAAYVYDIDHPGRPVKRLTLAGVSEIRGVGADIPRHVLYIAHGGDGGGNGNGSLAAYDLLRGRIIWDHHYGRGIDSFAISRDGARIYMPDGEASSDGVWSVLNAGTGAVVGRINGGEGPHNTVVGLSGRYVYLGGRNNDNHYLDVASTRTDQVIRQVGPLIGGVRPFTIDAGERYAFTTATGLLGFQVSSLLSGRVLYTVRLPSSFPYDPGSFFLTTPSHGISLSPDGRQLWVIDTPNAYVHVYDITALPGGAPRRVADIRLPVGFGGSQADCSVDCERDGWLQHSLSGCYVFVGDAGTVISTRTLRPVASLPALRNSRELLEIDWRGGRPVATSTRAGLSYPPNAPPARPSCP